MGHKNLITEQKIIDPLIILAVDDDPMTLISLSTTLSTENRIILTASDGEEALQIALKQQPHLIITDWRMPKLSGIELCKTLRKTKNTRHKYIIMLTSCETDDELIAAFDAGINDYIVKPFSPKVLLARVSSGERIIRYQQKIQAYATQLANANKKLQNIAMTDFLTGLPNRRNVLVRLKNLVAEVQRYGEPLSCIMVDIDHFKKINDTYGHDNGDIVLQKLGEILKEKARSYDMVSRWGGEEFLIICARSDNEDTFQLAERLRKAVAKTTIELQKEVTISLTISLGIASWSAEYQDAEQLLKEADNCLSQAKTNGRNRVEKRS